jgi:hypothetical protein
MTEGNFVDYVKIYVSSGKGGKDQRIYTEKNLLKKVVQMVVTVVVVGMYF